MSWEAFTDSTMFKLTILIVFSFGIIALIIWQFNKMEAKRQKAKAEKVQKLREGETWSGQ